jgi:hypothetical protein
MRHLFYAVCLTASMFACRPTDLLPAPQWQEVELAFTVSAAVGNPYTDIDFHVLFVNGPDTLLRPAFWDGGEVWKVRFASPVDQGIWNWQVQAEGEVIAPVEPRNGQLKAVPYTGENALLRHGLLRMSEGGRNVVHADGVPFLLVGDTPWALPWRATRETATVYARNRQERGFNAALLMTICPDRDAEGPDARDTEHGFARAFSDIRDGHINVINTAYFQYLDSLVSILIDHGIVPVHQPVFHGYGWKGQNVLGWNMVPEEYARFCQYLVARYGARPAFWLVSGDSHGTNAGVEEGGIAVEKWDAYRQPTGLHYSPFDDYRGDWMEPDAYLHYNKSFQDAPWLDFQWCQTGHGGAHLYHKVERMYDNQPVKAVANGEPTYEGIRDPANGAGWWQGEEAWMQLMSGGTMGVVYGAGGLWNWKITPEESGWPEWANSNVSWREAIELEGSRYVGLLARAFEGLDFADLEKRWDLAGGSPCLAKTGQLYVCYLPEGKADITLEALPSGLEVFWFNPLTGASEPGGTTTEGSRNFVSPKPGPMVLIAARR